jgi:NAD(P)-dependent dehydrogenase (short-subunit alcohol dehydrogenase family)
MIDINVHGVMLGMKLALPRFVARGEGHLINIASAAGKAPYPGGATYCGTKHFVVGVSETVRGELRGTGVDLSVVMPVVVDTELAAGLRTPHGIPRVQPEDVAAAIVETLRQGAVGRAVALRGDLAKYANPVPRLVAVALHGTLRVGPSRSFGEPYARMRKAARCSAAALFQDRIVAAPLTRATTRSLNADCAYGRYIAVDCRKRNRGRAARRDFAVAGLDARQGRSRANRLWMT